MQPTNQITNQQSSIIDKAMALLKDGAKRVEFDWQGKQVVAYWVGPTLRIDIKNF
jgi:hypothetical protein